MLKEVIGKILEAEQRAEAIERECAVEAEHILSQATIESEQLKSQPSKEINERIAHILKDAELKAEGLAKERLSECAQIVFDPKLIDDAVEAIVSQFLKKGLKN